MSQLGAITNPGLVALRRLNNLLAELKKEDLSAFSYLCELVAPALKDDKSEIPEKLLSDYETLLTQIRNIRKVVEVSKAESKVEEILQKTSEKEVKNDVEIVKLKKSFYEKVSAELEDLLTKDKSNFIAEMKKLKDGVTSLETEFVTILTKFKQAKARIKNMAAFFQELNLGRSPFDLVKEGEMKKESEKLRAAVEELKIENAAVKDLPELLKKAKNLTSSISSFEENFIINYLTPGKNKNIRKEYRKLLKEKDGKYRLREFKREFFKRGTSSVLVHYHLRIAMDEKSSHEAQLPEDQARKIRAESAKVSYIWDLFDCSYSCIIQGVAGAEHVLSIIIKACKQYQTNSFKDVSDFDEIILAILNNENKVVVADKLKKALIKVIIPFEQLKMIKDDPVVQYIANLCQEILDYNKNKDTINEQSVKLINLLYGAYVDYKKGKFDQSTLDGKLIEIINLKQEAHLGRIIKRREKDLPDLNSRLLIFLMRQNSRVLYVAIANKSGLHDTILKALNKINAEQKGSAQVVSEKPKESKDKDLPTSEQLRKQLAAAFKTFKVNRPIAVAAPPAHARTASAGGPVRGAVRMHHSDRRMTFLGRVPGLAAKGAYQAPKEESKQPKQELQTELGDMPRQGIS